MRSTARSLADAARGVTKTGRSAVVDTANAFGHVLDNATSTFKGVGDDLGKTLSRTGSALVKKGGARKTTARKTTAKKTTTAKRATAKTAARKTSAKKTTKKK